MLIMLLAREYLLWHYSVAYRDIIGITKNLLWFVTRLFSVAELLRSIFLPFKRLKEERVNIIKNPSGFFSNLAVNVIMRIVGFVIRAVFILVAFALLALIFLLCIFSLLFWTMLPVLVAYLSARGLIFLAV